MQQQLQYRLALGAERRRLLWMVLGEALGIVALGLVIGIPGSVLINKLAASTLYGVTTTDPITLGVAIPVLVLAAGLAAYIPALRATRVDPMIALRYE